MLNNYGTILVFDVIVKVMERAIVFLILNFFGAVSKIKFKHVAEKQPIKSLIHHLTTLSTPSLIIIQRFALEVQFLWQL